MGERLTWEIACKALQVFLQQKPFILFGTGTSCAVDSRFGMNALSDHLVSVIPGKTLSPLQLSQWKAVECSINNGTDLESAMNAVQDVELTQIIVDSTADFVASLDWEYSTKILSGQTEWFAVLLLKHILEGLPMSDRALHVATTNYDLLAEYALERAGMPYITGYCGGVNRSMDWIRSMNGVLCWENSQRGKTVKKVPKHCKHIRLYKVHGSLNTFRIDNSIIENNAWLYRKPETIERMIITPGIRKHERLQQNRAELLGAYDRAVAEHSAFLFIGFGFNDSQLSNDAIMRKLREKECPGLILTRDTNPRIERIITECKNVWLVCKPENRTGTVISNYHYSNPLLIDTDELWNPYVFAKIILGG